MSKTVTYYFTLISPFTYLGQPRVLELAKRDDLDFVYKPFDIMKIFNEVGALPPVKRHPSHQKYRAAELQRWSAKLGLPLNLKPAHFPVPTQAASCMLLAAMDAGADPGPLVMGILKAVWAEERNITEAETLAAIASECGLDGAALVAASQADGMVERFEASTAEAIADGVFGSPTFIVDDQIFWGQDRIAMLEEAL
ncbi:2-hydroxychromene-2-carboxylate isomerase [Magnetospira sp. QH-2]|uniref:2-hydroxychromene-2-carboxylate isomerase n=1 Tax=Magnetospira sp. (strain QH-2) TaxID=1288970 RepID=UPI0003E818AF|nr:2-hydroxychromene-2-carboxylate isomerase [Magnetospira sp. QH-2]CCQ74964.1 putative thioredoxin-like oxidoreductase [Magnetospira sp. QH-2]